MPSKKKAEAAEVQTSDECKRYDGPWREDVVKLCAEYGLRNLAAMNVTELAQLLEFWLRSIDVLVVEAPQIRASKTVIRVRWLLSEELFLIHRLRVYDVAMHPLSRKYYEKWKAWLSGDDKYRCREKKPRGLSKIYNKAIEVTCFKKEERPKEVIILPSRARRRGKRIIKVY